MQERENAIVQLEVSDPNHTQLLVQADPLRQQEDAELEQLEQDIVDMAETFTEIHKLVGDQGVKIGKGNHPGWHHNFSNLTIEIVIIMERELVREMIMLWRCLPCPTVAKLL